MVPAVVPVRCSLWAVASDPDSQVTEVHKGSCPKDSSPFLFETCHLLPAWLCCFHNADDHADDNTVDWASARANAVPHSLTPVDCSLGPPSTSSVPLIHLPSAQSEPHPPKQTSRALKTENGSVVSACKVPLGRARLLPSRNQCPGFSCRCSPTTVARSFLTPGTKGSPSIPARPHPLKTPGTSRLTRFTCPG